MNTYTELTAKRDWLKSEIEKIDTMRKGSLNSKYNKVKHKNGEIALNGPYYVLTKKEAGNKTVTDKIPAEDIAYVQKEVENYRRFRELTEDYVDVCDQLSRLGSGHDEGKKN